jgi:hypothetical protein
MVHGSLVRGLFAWDRGLRPVDLLFEVPPARRVLALQARGRRCVCLLDDAAARAPSTQARERRGRTDFSSGSAGAARTLNFPDVADRVAESGPDADP